MLFAVVGRPEMLAIKAVLDQKNSYALFLDSGMCKAGIAGTVHLAVCLFPGLQAHDARRHGRYEPEGILRGEVLDVPVVWTFRFSGAAVEKRPWRSHSCSSLRICRLLFPTAENCGFSAVAVHSGRCLPVATPRLIPMVLATIETPRLPFDMVVNAPIMQVVLVPGFQLPCRGAEPSPCSRLSDFLGDDFKNFFRICTLWFDSGSWTRCACTSLCNDRCRSSAVAVLTGVDTPVFAQWFIPMVLTIEISSYSLTRWSSSLLCRLCGALRCRVVVKVSLLPVLTFMHGSTLSRCRENTTSITYFRRWVCLHAQ